MQNRTYFGQQDLSTYHWVKFNVENNRVCYVLTGVFIVNLMGNSQNWLRQRIYLSIPIPALPRDQGIHLEQWAPLFTLSSIYNRNNSVNNGDAIDNFDLSDRELDPNYGNNVAEFYADIAVRDSDAFIYRIGYNITLKGVQKPVRPIIIP
jgi:hypothetical protein